MLAEAAGGLEAEEGGGEDHARTLHAAQLVRQHLPGEIFIVLALTINCPMVSTFPSTASVASSAPSMQSGQPSDTQSWGIQRPSHLHTCHVLSRVTLM